MTVFFAFLQCTSKSKGTKKQFVGLIEIHIWVFRVKCEKEVSESALGRKRESVLKR